MLWSPDFRSWTVREFDFIAYELVEPAARSNIIVHTRKKGLCCEAEALCSDVVMLEREAQLSLEAAYLSSLSVNLSEGAGAECRNVRNRVVQNIGGIEANLQ